MKELTIPLRADSHVPLYEQIYEYIKGEITNARISAGEKLPSTRLLAGYLSVSRSTVILAYDQLLSEGYIENVPRSGYLVCDIETVFPKLPEPAPGAGWRKGAASENGGSFAWASGSSHQEEHTGQSGLRSESGTVYDFSPYAVEWPESSMNAWRKATKAMLQEEMTDLFCSGESQGEENLREVICEYLHQSRGVNCDSSQVVIGAGNEYLLMLLYQVMEGERSIAMESPTYRQAYQIFMNLGWNVEPVPMDESGMLLPQLRASGAGLAYIMPSHQFPLGSVMPMKRRMELLQWAGEEEGRYIIEDDYDSEFRYKGKPIPSLQGSDAYGRVIYLGTFSKSIAPAIRVSYMVLPPRLLGLYQERCGFYSSTVSRIPQQTLYHFLKDGYFERHLNKMRGIYRARHDALLGALKGKAFVKRIWGENAGLHILVELAGDQSEEQIIREAMKHGIRVYGLGEYAIQAKTQNYGGSAVLLLGYAGLTETQIAQGVQKLSELII